MPPSIFYDSNAEPIPTVAPSTTRTPVEFLQLFTAPERIAMRASPDPVVQDFIKIVELATLQTVDLTKSTTVDAIGYLVLEGFLSEPRGLAVLSGIEP